MRRVIARLSAISALVLLVACGDAPRGTGSVVAAERVAPRFEVDPFWPRPLPNHWVLGSTIGVDVDANDNIWIIHRGAPTQDPKEIYAAQNPPAAECCLPAPPVLAFVSAQVRGVVTDAASGEPVEGAEVSWDDGSLGPGDAPHLETAADGRYEFEVRTRPTSQPSVHVQARKNGYAAEDREVKFQANETVSADFQLRAVASASGPR